MPPVMIGMAGVTLAWAMTVPAPGLLGTSLMLPVGGLMAPAGFPSPAASSAIPLARAASPDTATRKYEIHLSYTGYTGLADSEDCKALVNPAGYDSLTGTVTGIEPTGRSGDPTTYYGTLRRVVKIDYCLPADTGDRGGWCVATLTGSARMQVELEVYGDEGQGAWLRAEPDSLHPRPDAVQVSGNCAQADKDQIKADFPSGESGGTPGGQEIPETAPPRFHVSGTPKLRVGFYPADAQQGGWALRVVRVAP